MPDSFTPSSRRYLVGVPGVIEAGGVLRDMVGSLRNLNQLVRSMRVGPRGLERAIPDVHSACAPTIEAVHSLTALLAPALPPGEALDGLSRYVAQRMAEVATALDTASHRPMTAKNRLALEQVLGRVLPELEAGRDLLDLLTAAAWAPAVPSPLLDLLSTTPPSRAPVSRAGVTVKLDESLAPFELELSPRLLLPCLAILASDYVSRHGSGPVLQCRAQGTEFCLELNTSERPAQSVVWARKLLVEPSLETVGAALAAKDCRLVPGDHPRIVLPSELLRAQTAE